MGRRSEEAFFQQWPTDTNNEISLHTSQNVYCEKDNKL